MEVVEDQEALFHSYQCALYYVQSPSTLSHANSAIAENNFTHNNNNNITSINNHHHPNSCTIINQQHQLEAASRFTLSRYSSSRGSNNSLFLHEKKIISNYDDLQSQGGGSDDHGVNIDQVHHDGIGGEKCSRLSLHDLVKHVKRYDYDDDDEENEDELYYGRRRGLWRRYFSFRTSSSCAWFLLQIIWRLLVSLSVALLVFYLATKPPPPKISIQMAGIPQFGLGEGVDATGIPTKILTCNCTMDVVIDNKSKIFGLHISPPVMEMSFSHLSFAISHGPKLYAKSYESTLFELHAGTRNRPMYGAGRSMQDMLESRQGLPLVIHVSLRSSFRVLWNLIKPKFHHQAKCLLVLNSAYDKKHRTQSFNSTCIITS